jgi:hypothetical protein
MPLLVFFVASPDDIMPIWGLNCLVEGSSSRPGGKRMQFELAMCNADAILRSALKLLEPQSCRVKGFSKVASVDLEVAMSCLLLGGRGS